MEWALVFRRDPNSSMLINLHGHILEDERYLALLGTIMGRPHQAEILKGSNHDRHSSSKRKKSHTICWIERQICATELRSVPRLCLQLPQTASSSLYLFPDCFKPSLNRPGAASPRSLVSLAVGPELITSSSAQPQSETLVLGFALGPTRPQVPKSTILSHSPADHREVSVGIK